MEYISERAPDFNLPSLKRIGKTAAMEFKKVATEAEMSEIYRLRYRVYCEEKGFERPEDHPGRIECDEFDGNSIHFMASSGGHTIGTARLILGSDKELPIERHCRITADLSGLDRSRIGEISRLAVSKECCRADNGLDMALGARHRVIVYALYKLIYVESRKMGFTHWLAVMSEGLHQLLKKTGVVFMPIGPAVDYHGIRTPYLGSIKAIEAGVSRLNPELFKEASEELMRHLSYSLAV